MKEQYKPSPCPFCGSTDIDVFEDEDSDGLLIDECVFHCNDCDIQVRVYTDILANAIEQYNSRVSNPLAPATDHILDGNESDKA